MKRPTYVDGTPAVTTHELKCVSPYFEEVAAERKNYELRLNDRDYQVGDLLLLKHWVPSVDSNGVATGTYSGKQELRRITYMMRGPFIASEAIPTGGSRIYQALVEGWCIMSLSPLFNQ